MLRIRSTLLLALIAMVATLASTVVPGRLSADELGMVGCEKECSFLAAGWPFPFVVDGPGISPVGSANLLGVLLGLDTLLPLPLAEGFVLWFAGLVAISWLVAARRKLPLAKR